jgi:tRNA modification GTPase
VAYYGLTGKHNMPRIHDTIAALATPVGTSAIAVLRVSGEKSAELVSALLGNCPAPRLAVHADLHSLDGRLLDDVLLSWYQAPNSYTGEDSLEISCHGNPYIAQSILEDLFERGCRPAEPGEFTQRAFLNGKMDLSQAEAVMDVIHARGEKALAAAQQQLRGALGEKIQLITEELLKNLARIEVYIDFPDEDLPAEDRGLVSAALVGCDEALGRLLATSHYGELLRDGIKTIIIGEPNAGKSSLLNSLIGRERAIVSSEPGTTRDFIEECVLFGSYCFRLIDTAGLNPNPQALEKLGIKKTFERIEEADLFLFVVDPTQPPPPLAPELSRHLRHDNTILIINKADLLPSPQPTAWTSTAVFENLDFIKVSALHNIGIDCVKKLLTQKADLFQPSTGSDCIAINARHSHALTRARACLNSAQVKLKGSSPIELVSSDLREALDACGEIAGRIDNERMLDHLFSSFCIGK